MSNEKHTERDYSLLRPFDLEAAKRGEEFWAPAIGEYIVSSFGRVKGPKGIMTPSETHKGYLRVCISVDGKQVEAKVHRLVASAFIPNDDNLPQVNHIDGDKQNNNALNLEWCDNKHNQLHYRRVLKGGIVPLVAANDNETILFESGVAAQEAGHNRGEISRIINNPSRKHHGFNWYSKEVFEQKTGVLCWVEGRPVYRGDVLWWTTQGRWITARAYENMQNPGVKDDNDCESDVAWLTNLTWTPPKVKREGWVNIYPKDWGGIASVGSLVNETREDADVQADDNRIACVRIEWEEVAK